MKKKNGVIIYQGPSLIDGKEIVVIATGINNSTANEKTGDMIQTWILPVSIKPNEAVKTGEDYSVCGNCPHRPLNLGSCYVKTFHGPRAVYASFLKGNYPKIENVGVLSLLFNGMKIRLGSYGDPAAVPYHIWESLLKFADTHTGYTHQYKESFFDKRIADVCMVSADSEEDAKEAWDMGFRTFRVRGLLEDKLKGEAVCPASEEAGKKIDCAKCGACKGSATNRKGSIVIMAHGNTKKRFFKIKEVA